MNALHKIKQQVSMCLFGMQETAPGDAYNKWATSYDAQPDNLMLALDKALFAELIAKIDFKNKVIMDVGCGTGRHWEKIYAKQPAKIIGYDVSEGMLLILKQKFPEAETHTGTDNLVSLPMADNSCDIIISTLAIAHIQHIEEAFAEWNRILKRDGHIVITDYHPDTLAKGGNRTFMHNGKQIAIKNYVHPIAQIQDIASKLNFKMDAFMEKKIDETVKHYYEKQNALKVFERFNGTPIIYGARLFKV